MKESAFIAIDLKSFYASAECVQRGLDPIKTNLVVADSSRTEKTICLAVSPSLKSFGIPGRPRLFEVVQRVKQINDKRLKDAPGGHFADESYNYDDIKNNPSLKLSYIVAPPQMRHYMDVSLDIYKIYLKYIAPEDIHVYSIDEVFIDAGAYLGAYKMTARELAMKLINEIFSNTGITATSGIGTNLYLAKIAMDIVAKHMPPDENGVSIAELDEMTYRRLLWSHTPLTDFWRIGKGYLRKLEKCGLYTMGDIARCSIGKEDDFYNEDLLYDMFGVNAELLIDHAWGWEPCQISDIKGYQPDSHSLSIGQVLGEPYTYEKARLITQEMADSLSLKLVDKCLVADQVVLTVCYDVANLEDAASISHYKGKISKDYYGRKVPKPAHGSINLESLTSSTSEIISAATKLYDKIVNHNFLVRRIYIVANHVEMEEIALKKERETEVYEQLDFFTDYEKRMEEEENKKKKLQKERQLQNAMLDIKKKYGNNAILKGMNFEEGATGRFRGQQIGGHKA